MSFYLRGIYIYLTFVFVHCVSQHVVHDKKWYFDHWKQIPTPKIYLLSHYQMWYIQTKKAHLSEPCHFFTRFIFYKISFLKVQLPRWNLRVLSPYDPLSIALNLLWLVYETNPSKWSGIQHSKCDHMIPINLLLTD